MISIKKLLKEDRYVSNIEKTWDGPVDLEDDLRTFIGYINDEFGAQSIKEYIDHLKAVVAFAEKLHNTSRSGASIKRESFFSKKKEDSYDNNKYARKSKTPAAVPEVYTTEFKKELLNLTYKHMTRMYKGLLDPEDAAWIVDEMLQALIDNKGK